MKPFSILHISDLHRSPHDPISNEELLSALVGDRDRYTQEDPPVAAPEAVVVSGDLIHGVRLGANDHEAALAAQYEMAAAFLDELVRRFVDGDRSRVVIVPGNHDVDWNTAFGAMTPVPEATGPLNPPSVTIDQTASERPVATASPDSEVLSNQSQFQQKASNPQASLQPWLEQLIDGNGLVRCYATEDANPTKQLKNKLSQAAAARDGLLVLLLADESAFLKAREALLERWMTNVEWPKSVACVALSYPIGAPEIVALIERADSPWPQRVRSRLFPAAEVILVTGGDQRTASAAGQCRRCGSDLPSAARFCPGCGTAVDQARGSELVEPDS